MFIASWGKDAKEVGYWGIMKCKNCKNYTHFNIFEIANKVKLYFVTVAKYKRKRFFVCPVCDAGFEIKEEIYVKLLEEMAGRYDRDTTNRIWDEIDAMVVSDQTDEIADQAGLSRLISTISEKIAAEYGNQENATEIIRTYFSSIFDDDTAR